MRSAGSFKFITSAQLVFPPFAESLKLLSQKVIGGRGDSRTNSTNTLHNVTKIPYTNESLFDIIDIDLMDADSQVWQTFYPENWNENKISMAAKDVWRQNIKAINEIKDHDYHAFNGQHDGVKVVLGFIDGDLRNAYPDKWQK